MKTALLSLAAIVLALPAFAREIEGYVYAPDGTPIENATVSAYVPEGSAEQLARLSKHEPREVLRSATTSANGTFELEELPSSVIDLGVRAEGFAPQIVRSVPGDPSLSITLRRAATVEGRVTADGKAVAGAYVVWTGQHEVEHATITDEKGRYRVPDPSRWAREPMVFHPSYSRSPRTSREISVVDFELEPKASEEAAPAGDATISGVVRLDGKPLAGVPVILQAMTDRHVPPIRVVTGAKGTFTATGLARLRYAVGVPEDLSPRVRAPHQLRMHEDMTEPNAVDVRAERSASVALDLMTVTAIGGRVVDAEGKAVANAEVHIVPAGQPPHYFSREQAVRTRPNGVYSITPPPFPPTEPLEIAVTAPATATVRSKPFTLPDAARGVDITLPRFSRVTARVVGPDGEPVAGAHVAFIASSESSYLGDPAMLVSEHFRDRAVTTDASGEVSLALTPGTYDFVAAARGLQTRVLAEREIARGATIEIALEDAVAIRGRIHRGGTGVAGVNVSLLARTSAPRDSTVVTGDDGRFEIGGLSPGEYRLVASKMDELINRTVTVEAPAEVAIALPPAGAIRGRVVDAATREPIDEFFYTIEPLDEDAGARDYVPAMHRAERRGDGTFEARLSAGRYRVTAQARGYTAAEPIEVRVGDAEPAAVQIALDRGASISGRVTDEQGMPVADANVYVARPEAGMRGAPPGRSPFVRVAPATSKTAIDGAFSLTGIEPGEMTLVVRSPGFVSYQRALDVTGSTTVDVQLTRGVSLEGVVTREGRPVAEAQVGASTSAIGGEHQTAVTDASGRFELRGLVPARYMITAHKGDRHAEVHDVDITTQRRIAISLDAKPRGVIYGVVTGMPANLGRMRGRSVFAQGESGGAEASIDDAGNYRIENAPVGNVQVIARVDSQQGTRSSAPKRVDVEPGRPVRLDFDLAGGMTVRGRVTHDGKPLGGARVVFATGDGVAVSTMTRDDGTYDTSLPAPGLYRIFAHAEPVMTRHFETQREIRGSETIDIDLREQTIEGVVLDAATRQPIAGAFVTLTPEGGMAQPHGRGSVVITGETFTNENGRFRIVTAASGPHLLIAWAHGYGQRTQPVTLGGTPSRHVSFELSPVEELHVRAVDARTGAPLDAHVTVANAAGMYLPVRPERSADGSTFLISVAPGRYRITVMAQGYATTTVEVTAPGVVDVPME